MGHVTNYPVKLHLSSKDTQGDTDTNYNIKPAYGYIAAPSPEIPIATYI